MPGQNQGTIHIDWKPDKSSSIPLYSQIVSHFSDKILKGDWVVGQKIPSQRELSRLFGVNRSTIVEAMEELSALGIIEGRYGSGTKIVNDTWSLLMSNSTPNWQSYIDAGAFKANAPTVQSINKLEYDEGIIRLGTGEMSPELLPADMMKKVFHQLSRQSLSLNYPEPYGLLGLRQAICVYLKEKGIQVSPKGILITSGALQALQLISVCIVPPHSTVYVESPSYLKSLHVFQSAGTNLEGIPMDKNGMMPWMIKSGTVKSGSSILYTIPSFQNPTGGVMTEIRRAELLNFCKTNRMPIIEDDVLGELWLDSPPPQPIKAKDTSGIVLYVGSASKSLAPGLRVGWLAGPESVVERLADIKMQQDYGTSTLSQMVLTQWLESGLYQQYLEQLREKLRQRRDYMLELLEENFRDIATWEVPTGSFFVWMKVSQNVQVNKIFERALKENLLINPGSIYDFYQSQYIRLSYAYASLPQMKKGLVKLAKIIFSEQKNQIR